MHAYSNFFIAFDNPVCLIFVCELLPYQYLCINIIFCHRLQK